MDLGLWVIEMVDVISNVLLVSVVMIVNVWLIIDFLVPSTGIEPVPADHWKDSRN